MMNSGYLTFYLIFFDRIPAVVRARPSQQIEVFDIKNNTATSYDSMGEAARALNINKSVIDLYFIRNQQKPYKGLYIFNKK